MITLNPVRYPNLVALLAKHSIKVDVDTEIDDGWFTFKFEFSVRLPDTIAKLFD